MEEMKKGEIQLKQICKNNHSKFMQHFWETERNLNPKYFIELFFKTHKLTLRDKNSRRAMWHKREREQGRKQSGCNARTRFRRAVVQEALRGPNSLKESTSSLDCSPASASLPHHVSHLFTTMNSGALWWKSCREHQLHIRILGLVVALASEKDSPLRPEEPRPRCAPR